MAHPPPRLGDTYRSRSGGLAQAADDGQAADILPLAAELAARVHDVPHAADAVCLDGFSPARNPAMWQAQVLADVVRCCRPQARLVIYKVARSVRDAPATARAGAWRGPRSGRWPDRPA